VFPLLTRCSLERWNLSRHGRGEILRALADEKVSFWAALVLLTLQPVEKLNDEFLRDEEYVFLLQKDAKRHPLWRQLATFAVS